MMETSDHPPVSLRKFIRARPSAIRDFPMGCGCSSPSRTSDVATAYNGRNQEKNISTIRDFPPSCERNSSKVHSEDRTFEIKSKARGIGCNMGKGVKNSPKRSLDNTIAVDTDNKYHKRKKDSKILNEMRENNREVKPQKNTFRYVGQSNNVTRDRVRKALRLFQALCRVLSQEEDKGKTKEGKSCNRVDLKAARILKDHEKYVFRGNKIIGPIPGVEVGDEFHYRMELNIVGLHFPIQGGIDYINRGNKTLATSIVASGCYDDDTGYVDFLIYTGSRGNVMNSKKASEDQKLEKGNLALKNSIEEQNPVRVIRKQTRSRSISASKVIPALTFTYDGLYLVENYWQEPGNHGKMIFKYLLRRIPGQPKLAWNDVKKHIEIVMHKGLYVSDISRGRELTPISVVNTIDDEKPPSFTDTPSIIYPNSPPPRKGCDCTTGCLESRRCACVKMNGGIPYDCDGALVRAKPIVFECGNSCKCPSSCRNRVSQQGIKFQLEIFKSTSRGWGVRSLTSIPSGSFVCEYAGELLTERDIGQRFGSDDYLFRIGMVANDTSLWEELPHLIPGANLTTSNEVKYCGFCIDAKKCGNVGRFINHSCSPNLFVQYVLYDHENRKIPHVMLFAAENIAPLQELTYHHTFLADDCGCTGKMKKSS